MIVKIGKRKVDVADHGCAARDCFVLGFDKGRFSVGRGYTSYHTDSKGRHVERPVCMTRHLRGCPKNSVCPVCRSASVRFPGSRCAHLDCTGTLIEVESKP